MNTSIPYSRLLLLFAICALFGLLFVYPAPNQKGMTATHIIGSLPQSSETPSPLNVYLPIVEQRYPPPPPIFGTEMQAITTSHGLTYAVQAGIYWIRLSTFDWDRIEPERTDPPTYHWETVDESSLITANQNGFQVIATVKYTPRWAQKYEGSYCGPIREDALDAFAQFLTAAVERYSHPPYNVHYWEIGNEPDAPVWYNRSVFGCWGETDDPYYGGRYYGKMLTYAYPAIKAADPQAQVLIGGLLLDCDPDHPPEGKTCTSAHFLEGILASGAGNDFDIVNFHGYPYYDGTLQRDEHALSWEARGGIVLGKARFLREVLARYGLEDKPLFDSESALICPEWSTACQPPSAEFFEAQADYVVWLFIRNWAEGILGTVWYPFEGPGWRYSGLMDEEQHPKPVYDALAFLAREMEHASFAQECGTSEEDIRCYEFYSFNKNILVLWATDEEEHIFTLPENVIHVYDKYGVQVPFAASVAVSHPVYIEYTP